MKPHIEYFVLKSEKRTRTHRVRVFLKATLYHLKQLPVQIKESWHDSETRHFEKRVDPDSPEAKEGILLQQYYDDHTYFAPYAEIKRPPREDSTLPERPSIP